MSKKRKRLLYLIILVLFFLIIIVSFIFINNIKNNNKDVNELNSEQEVENVKESKEDDDEQIIEDKEDKIDDVNETSDGTSKNNSNNGSSSNYNVTTDSTNNTSSNNNKVTPQSPPNNDETIKKEEPVQQAPQEDLSKVANPNDFFYSITGGKVEFNSNTGCMSAGDEIALIDVVDVQYYRCYEVSSKANTIMGYFLNVFCASGKIKVVIVKNLSRLGRSNFECGYYMDYYFPSANVRFMTVQEEVDTNDAYSSNNEYAPLNNFMNEKYSRDLSKNIKNSKRVKQKAGEYIGSNNSPYGYKKDPADKHHLIIDEYSSTIVKKIYEWYLETGSQGEVRKRLFENKIPTPAIYRNYKTMTEKLNNPYQWSGRTIRYILTSQMYIGNMEQHKYEKKSFRSKKLSRVPKEKWIIVENKHEPIIDKDTWDKVQNMIKNNYKRASTRPPELFTGMLICHECKHRMSISTRDKIGKDGTFYHHQYTQCNYYRKNRNLGVCSLHSTNYLELEKDVLKKIDEICNKFIKLISYQKVTNGTKMEMSSYERILNEKIIKLEFNLSKIDCQIEKLYMDRLNDVISVDTYQKISAKFETEKEQLKTTLEEMKNTYIQYQQDNNQQTILSAKELSEMYIKHRKKLDRELIMKIVDRIEIHEDKSIDLFLKIKPLEQLM